MFLRAQDTCTRFLVFAYHGGSDMNINKMGHFYYWYEFGKGEIVIRNNYYDPVIIFFEYLSKL